MTDAAAMSSTLESMGFEAGYIKRAIKVFKRNYPGKPYNMELIIEIISRLEAKDAGKKKKGGAAAKPVDSSSAFAVSGEGDIPGASAAADSGPGSGGALYAESPEDLLRSSSSPEHITPGGGFEMGQVFHIGDTVYYSSPTDKRVVKAEVVKVMGMMQIQISYPLSAPVFSRRKAMVNPRDIEQVPTKGGPDHIDSPLAIPAGSEYKGPLFTPFLPASAVKKLKVGDKIDHRDEVGRYVHAEIVERKGDMVKVHYIGWSRKWDCYSDLTKDAERFIEAESISKRPAHRFTHFKKGDFIDICPKLRHPRIWLAGEIRRLDKNSGQVQVVYEKDGKNYLYWAHLDDQTEIDEFTKRSGTSQASQMEVFDEIRAKEERKRQKQLRKEERKRKRAEKRQQKEMMWKHTSDKDHLETMKKMREKRFPKLRPDEEIENKFAAGDWLEVQDAATGRWILATVTDGHNNWIVVHYDGYSAKYDQRVHVVEMKERLRGLGSDLEETDVEIEIREEMEQFKAGLEEVSAETGSTHTLVEIGADGNCLFRSFAHQIYDDEGQHKTTRKAAIDYITSHRSFFCNFIFEDWEETLKRKRQEYEWGDHLDLTALSEHYNVRVRVYELDKVSKKLFVSAELGQSADPHGTILPLILLARHREKHYNIITSEAELARKPRPLGDAKARAGVEPQDQTIRQVRINEEMKYQAAAGFVVDDYGGGAAEVDEDESSADPDDEDDGTRLKVELTLVDFGKILAKSGQRPPLSAVSIGEIMPVALEHFYEQVKKEWEASELLSKLDEGILTGFYESRYGDEGRMATQTGMLLAQIKEKAGSGISEYALDLVLATFNQVVADKFCENLYATTMSQLKIMSGDVGGAGEGEGGPGVPAAFS